MLIGITDTVMIPRTRWQKLLKPFINDLQITRISHHSKINRNIDLIIFDGGADVTPYLYGERPEWYTHYNLQRDLIERTIALQYMRNERTKYVGICRGHQFLNTIFNGTLHQDLNAIKKGHEIRHDVTPFPNSEITKYIKELRFEVNSYHHQAIREIGTELKATLFDPLTEVIEGIESDTKIDYLQDKVRAVQCHPEDIREFAEAPNLIKYLFRLPI